MHSAAAGHPAPVRVATTRVPIVRAHFCALMPGERSHTPRGASIVGQQQASTNKMLHLVPLPGDWVRRTVGAGALPTFRASKPPTRVSGAGHPCAAPRARSRCPPAAQPHLCKLSTSFVQCMQGSEDERRAYRVYCTSNAIRIHSTIFRALWALSPWSRGRHPRNSPIKVRRYVEGTRQGVANCINT